MRHGLAVVARKLLRGFGLRAATLMFLFCGTLYCQVADPPWRDVPIGTEGNRFVLSIENRFPRLLQAVNVRIGSSPEWTVFTTSNITLQSISPGEVRDAVFDFRVLNVETGKRDSVQLVILDPYGHVFGHSLFRIQTAAPVSATGLEAAYPNPANPSVTLRYSLQAPSHVTMQIYDILGRLVRTFVEEQEVAGRWSILWDGRNDHGMAVASGVYFARMITMEKTGRTAQFTSKILIQK